MLSAQNLVPAQHKNGKWGYWGEETRREFGSGYPYTFEGFIIKPTFEAAYPFEIGRNSYRWYAFVKKKGLWGVINSSGKFVAKPKYTSVSKSNPYQISVVEYNGKLGLAQGPNELSAIDYDSIDELCLNTHCGPYGNTPCSYRYFRTKCEGKYGLLDFKCGSELCPAICDNIEIRELERLHYWHDPIIVFLVKFNGKYGLLDEGGKVIVPARYDSIKDFGWCNYSKDSAFLVNGKVCQYPTYSLSFACAQPQCLGIRIDTYQHITYSHTL